VNTNLPAGLAHALEMNYTVNLGKQGIVLAHPYVLSWMKLCAYLSHQDIPGSDSLTAKTLDTTSLGSAVSTVP
jgi:hypothetical protein